MAKSDLIGQREQRIEKVKKLRELGYNPYPSKIKRTKTNHEVKNNFDDLEGSEVSVAGRIMTWREHGKLVFADLQDKDAIIQLFIREDTLESSDTEIGNLGWDHIDLLDIGDFVSVHGEVMKTKTGEISILVDQIKVASKAIRPLPEKWEGLQNKEERFRRRYLDMTMNPEIRERFRRRATFWNAVRDFFNDREFYEVNIPVLEHVTGGADAKPFKTYFDLLDENFYLRISHELPLKRLLGGGFEKVYDIGPRFRNEGLDDEHLPEHIAMEFYWAYANYEDGMDLLEDMYKYIIEKTYGTLEFHIKGFDINLDQEWQRRDFETMMKEEYPGIDIYNDSVEDLNTLLKSKGVTLDYDVNRARVVDNLWKLIRKTIAGPIFVTGLPKFFSPLSKSKEDNPAVVERIYPLIAGSELGNGFSELNDPLDQYQRFKKQQEMRESGDEEAHMLDIDFVEMLEYGMPPAFGFGMSERVFWFFEDVTAKEGVPFPQLRHKIDETTMEIYPYIRQIMESEEKDDAATINYTQDMSKKITIVINENLEDWKVLNTIGHISAYLGHETDNDFYSGPAYSTKDGEEFDRTCQYPIIVLSANPSQLQQLRKDLTDTNLMHYNFLAEHLEVEKDEDIAETLSDKTTEDIELYGIGILGDRDKLKDITGKFSLWRF